MTPTFLATSERSAKPRTSGITHVLDKGLPLSSIRNLMPSIAQFVDLWKFGWGLAYIDPEVFGKVTELRGQGIRACPGGTLTEIAFAQGCAHEYLQWAKTIGFELIEVSSGATDMDADDKSRLIAQAAAEGFEVLAEVGSKDPSTVVDPAEWAKEITRDLEAGATWIVAEGRESGTVGLYHSDGGVRSELVQAIQSAAGDHRVVYEAPQRAQQAWLLRAMGSGVNLGNIAVAEVPSVETLRLGLRTDTIGFTVTGDAATGDPAMAAQR